MRSVCSRLSWLSPHYLEKTAEDACARRIRDRLVDVPDVERSMDRMLDLDKRTYWSTWREHLDRTSHTQIDLGSIGFWRR